MSRAKTRKATPKPAASLSPAAPVAPATPHYRCSPEHKTHPGSWGNAEWHPRDPELSPCPTDIVSDAVTQEWLEQALARPECWQRDPDDGPGDLPRYLYWYVPARDRLFIARKTQLAGAAGQGVEYKGYPATERDVAKKVADGLLAAGIIPPEVHDRLRRARRTRKT